MVSLVTLEQAKIQCRVDGDDDDMSLKIMIEAASDNIISYIAKKDFLNSGGEPDYDSAGDPVGVPAPIQQATLILVASMYENRSGEEFTNPEASSRQGGSSRTGTTIMPRVCHLLLDPFRRPLVV